MGVNSAKKRVKSKGRREEEKDDQIVRRKKENSAGDRTAGNNVGVTVRRGNDLHLLNRRNLLGSWGDRKNLAGLFRLRRDEYLFRGATG